MTRRGRPDEYSDPARVRQWLLSQREQVVAHLAGRDVRLKDKPTPEWDLAPYVALWSLPGGWAISGDLPTDFVLTRQVRSPREALRLFGHRLAEAAEAMMQDPERPRELGLSLAGRAELLGEFADDDDLWPEQLSEWQERLE